MQEGLFACLLNEVSFHTGTKRNYRSHACHGECSARLNIINTKQIDSASSLINYFKNILTLMTSCNVIRYSRFKSYSRIQCPREGLMKTARENRQNERWLCCVCVNIS